MGKILTLEANDQGQILKYGSTYSITFKEPNSKSDKDLYQNYAKELQAVTIKSNNPGFLDIEIVAFGKRNIRFVLSNSTVYRTIVYWFRTSYTKNSLMPNITNRATAKGVSFGPFAEISIGTQFNPKISPIVFRFVLERIRNTYDFYMKLSAFVDIYPDLNDRLNPSRNKLTAFPSGSLVRIFSASEPIRGQNLSLAVFRSEDGEWVRHPRIGRMVRGNACTLLGKYSELGLSGDAANTLEVYGLLRYFLWFLIEHKWDMSILQQSRTRQFFLALSKSKYAVWINWFEDPEHKYDRYFVI